MRLSNAQLHFSTITVESAFHFYSPFMPIFILTLHQHRLSTTSETD
jgi:hypothetical protein